MDPLNAPTPLSRARPLWLRDARHELLWFGVFALLPLGWVLFGADALVPGCLPDATDHDDP